MRRWGHLMARRRWVVLVVGLVAIVTAGGWGLGVFGSLSAGGFEDPDSESARAEALITDTFGPTEADLLVLYAADDGRPVADPAVRHAVTSTVEALPAADVVAAPTAWTGGGRSLVSADGTSTLVPITLAGADDDAKAEAYERIAGRSRRPRAEHAGGRSRRGVQRRR